MNIIFLKMLYSLTYGKIRTKNRRFESWEKLVSKNGCRYTHTHTQAHACLRRPSNHHCVKTRPPKCKIIHNYILKYFNTQIYKLIKCKRYWKIFCLMVKTNGFFKLANIWSRHYSVHSTVAFNTTNVDKPRLKHKKFKSSFKDVYKKYLLIFNI